MGTKRVHPNNPAITNPQWAAELFVNGQNPRTWLRVARRLHDAALVLIEKEGPVVRRFERALQHQQESPEGTDWVGISMPNFDVAHLLMAFAIENLLKGIIIAKGLVEITAGGLPEQLKTHDLRTLNEIARPCAKIREYMLNYLWFMAEWRGRYPTPTDPPRFWPMSSQGNPSPEGVHWNQHPELLAYHDGLESELLHLVVERDSAVRDRV